MLTYPNGDPIRIGDKVRIDGDEGIVETLITRGCPDWDDYWHQHGEGVVLTAPAFGRLFVSADDPDLELARRK